MTIFPKEQTFQYIPRQILIEWQGSSMNDLEKRYTMKHRQNVQRVCCDYRLKSPRKMFTLFARVIGALVLAHGKASSSVNSLQASSKVSALQAASLRSDY